MRKEIEEKLKTGREQEEVVGPIVEELVNKGWDLSQIVFGKKEWKVPKTPSEASKRESGQSFEYFPVDIAVFESPELCNDYRHLLFIIECKQPDITVGVSQLETYLGLEPHVKLGIWVNSPKKAADSVFVFKDAHGLQSPRRRKVKELPSIGMEIKPDARILRFKDLGIPTGDVLFNCFNTLLDEVVARDNNVTRREEQLDQLCNLILLKLRSDKDAKMDRRAEVSFHLLATERETAKYINERFKDFTRQYLDIFTSDTDREIKLDDASINGVVSRLEELNLIDVGPNAVSYAFQVLRSAALKQKEGQFFTPQPVIEAAVEVMDIKLSDIIIDSACGTGGFLIECLNYFKKKFPREEREISRWAQLNLFGIDKDAIAIKLTKAIMIMIGDGSAHCVRGDSVLTHTWPTMFPHLLSRDYSNGRFDKVFTNPPFGAPLKIKYSDAKKSGLSILDYVEQGTDLELGLLMFNRCCDLLRPGGRMCIVLPETYFFSPSYRYVRDWVEQRLRPICIINVPMDAFQGFCRAKTNLYIFEKLKEGDNQIIRNSVDFLNPQTCGIYKNGSPRYVVDSTGKRTKEIDNALITVSKLYRRKKRDSGVFSVKLKEAYKKDVLVPQYYDFSYQRPYDELTARICVESISVGELCESGVIEVLSGHGSPSNDLRKGTVPYVKVSDIRNLRININPTNLIPLELAKQFWKQDSTTLHAWDLISPSRASSNIGEFAILLPGEEGIVITKEVFIIRVRPNNLGITPFYLLWALSLKEVRLQWKRITLMQTNREDVGNRYREILIPKPISVEWAEGVSSSFRAYFEGIADAKRVFAASTKGDGFDYIASVSSYNHSDLEKDILESSEDIDNSDM